MAKTLHHIAPGRDSLHGQFSRELAPAITIDPGDTVRFSTLDVAWGLEPPTDTVSPRSKWGPREGDRDDGPAMCGPVHVRGAEPGQTLEITIEHVLPGEWGYTFAGGAGAFDGALNQALGVAESPERLLIWSLDAANDRATNQLGHRVAMKPFLGVMGLAPAEPGWHPGWFPRATGGNMDCKELTVGSVLYLPIAVPGALFSCGDGHAAQGDGEVGGMAIECRMARADLRFEVWDNFPITTPHIRMRTGWVTLGFDQDLAVAAATATRAMVDLIARRHALPRADAVALASVCVDLRVTQLVNGVRGVHAVLLNGAIQ